MSLINRKLKSKGVVDRIEGAIAVLHLGEEQEESVEMPLTLLPDGVCEGDIIDMKVEIKKNTTAQAKKKVQELIARLKDK